MYVQLYWILGNQNAFQWHYKQTKNYHEYWILNIIFRCKLEVFRTYSFLNLQHILTCEFTHELINLHISAMADYINTLDGERSVHGRCEPKCFKGGDLFWKIWTSLYANFRKKKSYLIRPVEGLKLCLDFLCNVRIT